ncbi:hypothetical protein G3480_11860 [Thiorhodococcus mannitoliphagus]|uniref:Uncharacterized protein n=1 Tax=Thiorhodococcus mannitoliphagus TaxID=329406 RepID=A0A6P1DSE8_9GAMM|nr:hypothetical protein [Thiorhodococcus mannitoliphagus]NEX20998.1 hypothetical protein [Thiorhodococcus mannitoliphagus]
MAASRLARLNGYLEEVEFALDMGDGPLLRETRGRLGVLELDAEEEAELGRLDALVVDQVRSLNDIQSFLLEDDPSHPLEHWWWHLGKLRDGSYPANLLPEHLREVYEHARDEAA